MKTIYIFTIFVFFFLVNNCKPHETRQSEIIQIRKMINDINSLKLKKYILRREGDFYKDKKWRPLRKDEFHYSNSNNVFLPQIYLDDNSKIRRYVVNIQYPESGGRITEYFTEKGNLCYIIFDKNLADEYDLTGNIFYYNNRPIKIDTLLRFYDITNPNNVKILKNTLPPQKYFTYHANTEILKTKFNLKLIDLKKYLPIGYYSFKNPMLNDSTFINTNDVLIREKPTRDSNVISRLNIFDCVKILAIDKQESIGEWGKHNWYKVASCRVDAPFKQNGYVFGAFLEPVEVEVK